MENEKRDDFPSDYLTSSFLDDNQSIEKMVEEGTQHALPFIEGYTADCAW